MPSPLDHIERIARIALKRAEEAAAASQVSVTEHGNEAHDPDFLQASELTSHQSNADSHHDEDHATRHADGGDDELAIDDLPTAEEQTNLRLAPDGAGGVEWAATSGITNTPIPKMAVFTSSGTFDATQVPLNADGDRIVEVEVIGGGASGAGVSA